MDNLEVSISIIMPVYNSEKYLKDCVNSILLQELSSFELLLIDDGSTDSSPAICDEIALNDSRVKVFHKENGGICEARNFGLERATGEYIAFSDHDDMALPGFLQDNFDIAKKYDADIVKFGRKALYIEKDNLKRTDIRQYDFRVLKGDEICHSYLKLRLDNAMTCVWDGLFRKKFLEDNNIKFDVRYKKGGEDIDFCGKSFAVANVLVLNNSIYYEHYIRKGYSTSTKKNDSELNKLNMLIHNLDDCCAALSISTNEPGYKLCVMKELVYPTFSYLASQKTNRLNVKRKMDSIYNMYFNSTVKLISLIRINKKWGIFTWLFELKIYWVLYKIVSKRVF